MCPTQTPLVANPGDKPGYARPCPISGLRRAILIVYLHLHSKLAEEAATDIFIVPQRQRRMHKSLKCCTYIIIRQRARERERDERVQRVCAEDMFQLARQLMGQVCSESARTQAKVIRLVILGCDKCSYRPDVITFPCASASARDSDSAGA